MKRFWNKDAITMRMYHGNIFPLPKANPAIERWQWPVIVKREQLT